MTGVTGGAGGGAVVQAPVASRNATSGRVGFNGLSSFRKLTRCFYPDCYHRPAVARGRAMFVATFSIAVVGWERFVGRLGYDNAWVWLPLILAPLLAVIVRDLTAHRKVFAVMAAGLLAHVERLNAEVFVESEWWLPVGRALIAPFR